MTYELKSAPTKDPDPRRRFQHYKGGYYRIVTRYARMEATGESVTVYESEADGVVWVRPTPEFNERFREVL